jgi:hypothetical protein
MPMIRRCISHQVLDPGTRVNDPHRAWSPLRRDLHVCRLAPVSTSHRIIRLQLDLRRSSLVARRFSMARSPEAVRTAAQEVVFMTWPFRGAVTWSIPGPATRVAEWSQVGWCSTNGTKATVSQVEQSGKREGLCRVSAADDIEAALASLGIEPTDDRRTDLIRAAQEAMRRRERNTIDGGAVIAALVEMGMSYRDIERATGIPHVTAHRWAAPPRTIDQTDS